MTGRTHLILDGLQDPKLARDLSLQWERAGFDHVIDPAGQAAWVAKADGVLTEAEVDRAAAIARGVGLEVRDRVGSAFRPDNDLATLRERMVYEYKSRFATAVVFGLPAVVLHYIGPVLAGGAASGGSGGRAMAYPWFFEMILVGWACLAGWPILWQGALSLLHLRVTADLLTSAIVLTTFLASVVGFVSLAWTPQPWFLGGHPFFHAAMITMILALAQRWLAHRAAARLSGRAMLMLPGFSTLISLWLLASILVAIFSGVRTGIAFAMVLPPMISLGAVNRWSPGWSVVFPVLGFVAVLLFGPRVLGRSSAGMEIETAAGFQLMMIIVMALGWKRPAKAASSE